jgi:hypothetical protein
MTPVCNRSPVWQTKTSTIKFSSVLRHFTIAVEDDPIGAKNHIYLRGNSMKFCLDILFHPAKKNYMERPIGT